jgi:hypothetical protein
MPATKTAPVAAKRPKTGGRKLGVPNRPKPRADASMRVDGGAALPETAGKLPPYRLVPIDSLTPYDRNARVHSTAQIDMLARLITEYGWTNPVIIDGKRGVIAGHGRLLAARKLGMDVVPTIELRHLSAAQKRAYVLADNASALQAGWDSELLSVELGELRADGFDLSLTGFDASRIELLLGGGEETSGTGSGDGSGEVCPTCGRAIAPAP